MEEQKITTLVLALDLVLWLIQYAARGGMMNCQKRSTDRGQSPTDAKKARGCRQASVIFATAGQA